MSTSEGQYRWDGLERKMRDTTDVVWTCTHVRRKDDGYIGRRMLRMELPGKRKRGRPKRRCMDAAGEDMAVVDVTEEDSDDRTKWRWKLRCGNP